MEQPAKEDYDEAVLNFTRFSAMDAENAARLRAALSSGMFDRRPNEISSLYEPY